jgi:alcohol dehydrogenase (cytochrome c)
VFGEGRSTQIFCSDEPWKPQVHRRELEIEMKYTTDGAIRGSQGSRLPATEVERAYPSRKRLRNGSAAKALLLSSLLLPFAAFPGSAQTNQELLKPDPSNWYHYSGTYNSQRHSLLKQITAANAKNLVPKWIYHLSASYELEAVPAVVNGVMFIAQFNHVDAIDARTGRLVWQWQRQPESRGAHRGLAVFDNKVYVGTADAHVVALDARNGAVIWETKMEGEGVRYQGGAPQIIKDKVIIGGNSRTGGFIDAYNAETGKHAWRWNAIPKPGEPGNETWEDESWKLGGGPMWHTGSYDPEQNLIMWGTGQPAIDFIGDVRKGDNLYTDSMVALDADTGKMKWYFQFTPHDVHDYDAVELPILVDAPFKGQMRKLLVQANRNGYYYILDRTTGKFLQGTPFVKEITWASGLTEDGRPIAVAESAPSVQGTKVCPSTAGATNWPAPAYNPDTKYFYLVVQEGCGVNFRATSNYTRSSGSGTGYTEAPEVQDQWQLYVRALDLTTGKKIWDYKQVGSKHYGPGVLSTAGGLIFAPEHQGTLTALDARTGKPLWHFNTGDFVTSSPIAYAVEGNEYIALSSGTNIIAFGLPDTQR